MNDDIRIFTSDPNATIARLAQLDSKRAPQSPVLALEVAGQLRAALPLDGTPAIADPFHPTTQLIKLLELRSTQLSNASDDRRTRLLSNRARALLRRGQPTTHKLARTATV